MARKKASKKKARFGKKSREWRKNKSSGKANYLNALPEGIEFFKPKGGKKYTFDILPYVVKDPDNHPASKAINEDGLFWCLPFRIHRNTGPNELTVICPASVGRACCACNERSEIYNDPDRDDEEAKPLNSSARTLFIIKMLKGPDKGKIMIMDISDYCFLEMFEEELDDLPEEYEDFACLEDGYSIEVRFKEEKIGKTPYPKASKITFIEREKDYDESILDEVPCLDDLITWPTSEKMEKLFYGTDNADGSDDDEKPKTKKSKKSKKAKKEPESDEDELDDDEEEDEDDEPDYDITWEDLLEMDQDDLIEVIENEELDIDKDEAEEADEDELRDFIAQELGIKKPIKEKKKKTKKKSTAKERKNKKKGKSRSTKKALECPYAYQFGVEFEDHEECDDEECEMYEKCLEAFENED